MEEKIKEILKEFGAGAYWYGETYGDYDLNRVEEFGEEFFTKAVSALKELIEDNHKRDTIITDIYNNLDSSFSTMDGK
jgi:hypothetical protein